MSNTTKMFHFDYSATVNLDVEAIWPDGDAPENPTVDDVLKVIKSCGGAERILRDWDLDHHMVLTVSDDKDSKEAP